MKDIYNILDKNKSTEEIYVIREGVTEIPEAFADCSKVTSIVIPDSVTSIGAYAFRYCTGLTNIVIPDSVTNIGDGAFEGCIGLTSISVDPNNLNFSSLEGILYDKEKTKIIKVPCGNTGDFVIPNSVISIASYSFSYCTGLTSIVIPNSVTNIEYSAFKDCIKLNRIHCQIKNIKNVKIKTNIFKGCDLSNCILSVPTGADNDYKHHPVFSKFKNIVIEG